MDGPKRYANYHGHGRKNQVIGNQAGRAPPAWKDQQAVRRAATGQGKTGSKILLSMLPADVGEDEVKALFVKTVGPVQEAFTVYNSQGGSKGMAIVTFHRPGDAAVARQMYHGKIIDSRRPIKIEIIKDEDPTAKVAPAPPQVPSLLQRLQTGGSAPVKQAPQASKKRVPQTHAPAPTTVHATPRTVANAARKPRKKKGPKRVKKTAAQLDAEMEDYRALQTDDVKP
ncbi:hypothetical protein PHLGIDRAFT_129323 [Phlebiopsis gigantea 11061_1 CR5-6]|uniref:RRM domain-containing protein n=1 Tax=Phlebiopsis gigantea (strain 11061_1 CR5-6) TaxID=745531 RepID=A0A0C3PGA4_PHLG1|nr:hypothetical protein PHLGIDRAFT_129323 [Phlebiopsis gigantea 11061_1 CR5-6]